MENALKSVEVEVNRIFDGIVDDIQSLASFALKHLSLAPILAQMIVLAFAVTSARTEPSRIVNLQNHQGKSVEVVVDTSLATAKPDRSENLSPRPTLPATDIAVVTLPKHQRTAEEYRAAQSNKEVIPTPPVSQNLVEFNEVATQLGIGAGESFDTRVSADGSLVVRNKKGERVYTQDAGKEGVWNQKVLLKLLGSSSNLASGVDSRTLEEMAKKAYLEKHLHSMNVSGPISFQNVPIPNTSYFATETIIGKTALLPGSRSMTVVFAKPGEPGKYIIETVNI